MNLNKDYKQVDISEIDKLVNGDVRNYIDHYWLVTKDDKILLHKSGTFMCNRNIICVELLAKSDDFKNCKIVQIPLVCVSEHKLKKLTKKA